MATRLSINVNDETARTLKELASLNETSVTEIVRRAVGAYRFIDEGVRKGQTVKLEGRDEVTTLALI